MNAWLRRSVSGALVALIFLLAASPASRAADLSRSGPFAAAWTRVQVTRSDDGSRFSALLYYPGVMARRGAALDRSAAPYPAIGFAHGFLSSATLYTRTYAHLASWGYIVIAPESGMELFPSHARFAADLSFSLGFLEDASADPFSFLHDGVALDRLAVSGHSMGGGVSILAAVDDDRIIAVANLAAAETFPSAINRIGQLEVPVALIAGSADKILTPNGGPDEMYDAAVAPRLLATIDGASHCGFLSAPIPFCDRGEIAGQQQLAITHRLLTAFFNLYLRGDESAWPEVWALPLTLPDQVEALADPGIELEPAVTSLSARAGAMSEFRVRLVNTGAEPSGFTLGVLPGRWPVSVFPFETPVLAPGEAFEVTARVAVPAGTRVPEDRAIVWARRSDRPDYQYAQVRTMLAGR